MSAHPRATPSRLLGVLLAGVLGLGLLVATPGAARAAAAAPVVSSPTGGTVTGVPTLSWEPVPGAPDYRVQLSTAEDFSSTIVNAVTVNRQYVPTVQVRNDQPLYWRVQQNRPTGGDWSGAFTFQRTDVAPTLIGPADAAVLEQPATPPVLSWNPVPGASTYEVQVGTDLAFVDQTTTSTTSSSSLAVGLQPTGTWLWRVRGKLANNTFTPWSDGRRYEITGLPSPVRVAPAEDEVVQDVVLEWTPVPGATTYEVQVSPDINFVTRLTAATTVATRWSPARTLGNDTYFWRVRPVDAAGNRPAWNPNTAWRFKRAWPFQATLVAPADRAVVSDPFFQWTPIRHASAYVVEVARSSTFTGEVGTCRTVHTTLTRGNLSQDDDGCFPSSQGTYYWRVRGADEFTNTLVQTVFLAAPVQQFTYNPGRPTLVSPLRTPVTVPTLRWAPLAGAVSYAVSITGPDGFQVSTTTDATSFTPRTVLRPGTYSWDVQSIRRSGERSTTLTASSRPTFDVVEGPPSTATTPTPSMAHFGRSLRFPTLRWRAVEAAKSYTMYVRRAEDTAYTRVTGTFAYPAGEDLGSTFLAAGDYDWFVEANLTDGTVRAGQTARFTIDPVPVLDRRTLRAAMSSTELGAALRQALDDPAANPAADPSLDACDLLLPSNCENLRQTPTLGWLSPDANIGFYRLVLAYDREMTNFVPGFDGERGVVVDANSWQSRSALPDSQAGTAYHVVVLPCIVDDVCQPLDQAQHAFNKLSRAATLVSPADGAEVADDVTLTWDDYLDSLAVVDGADPDAGSVLDSPATTEARQYIVQTSSDQTFSTGVTSTEVDQRTFTAASTTYPEGRTWWRVLAVDGSGSRLTTSAVRSFVKRSPVPQLTAPADGATVSGDSVLRWAPLEHARGYLVEVYRNTPSAGDISAANRVASTSTPRIVSTMANLSPAGSPYLWRVRREDAAGRPGDWSVARQFSVEQGAPAFVSPSPGAGVHPSYDLFRWSSVPRATRYRFERRVAGQTATAEVVDTVATSWAPAAVLPGGAGEWRVLAHDAAGNVLNPQQTWQSFTVADRPVATSSATIDGSGQVGTQLTARAPVWDLGDIDTTYQWSRAGTAISGATSSAYLVTTADLGKPLTVTATGSLDGYRAGTSTSNAVTGVTGAAIIATSRPVVSGTPAYRSVLSATPGTWPGSPTYAYQWVRDGFEDIAGATRSTYTVAREDTGHALSVRVTATATGYNPGTSSSDGVSVPSLPTLSAASTPTVSGSGVVGTTLTGTTGSWPGSPTFALTWLRDAEPITGATRPTYVVQPADVGHALTLRVVASSDGWNPGEATSNPVIGAARSAASASTPPGITGSAIVKGVLTATPGTWPAGSTFAYQWLRDGAAVSGATRQSYTVQAADAGRGLTVRVTATAAGYDPGQATSGEVRIGKVDTTTTILVPAKISRKARAKVTVTVVAPGIVDPTGAITVLDGAKRVASAQVAPGSAGKVVVKLKKLKPGKHVLKAIFGGSDTVRESTSGTRKLKVAKR